MTSEEIKQLKTKFTDFVDNHKLLALNDKNITTFQAVMLGEIAFQLALLNERHDPRPELLKTSDEIRAKVKEFEKNDKHKQTT